MTESDQFFSFQLLPNGDLLARHGGSYVTLTDVPADWADRIDAQVQQAAIDLIRDRGAKMHEASWVEEFSFDNLFLGRE